jgi:hypothetical protein
LPTLAKQGLGLQQRHIHALALAETHRHAQHAVDQSGSTVGQGVGQLLGTLHHAPRLTRSAVASSQGQQKQDSYPNKAFHACKDSEKT